MNLEMFKGRKIPFFSIYTLLICFFLIDYYYTLSNIDLTIHWRERETVTILPSSIEYFLRPLENLIIILMIARLSTVFIDVKYQLKRNTPIVSVEVCTLLFLVLSSGNRWYFALLLGYIFLFSGVKMRLLIIGLFPIAVISGTLLSALLLAVRVNAPIDNIFDLIFGHYIVSNWFDQLSALTLQITEGVNFFAFLALVEKGVEHNPLYFIEKTVTVIMPNFLMDKSLPFNIVAAHILDPTADAHQSINTTILGLLYYGFSVFGLLFFVLFASLVSYLVTKVENQYIYIISFGLAFAASRFGFDYLILELLYLMPIVFLNLKLDIFKPLGFFKHAK